MRATNAIITRTDARLIGLYPLATTPPDSNRLATKGWLKANYYVDQSAYPFSVYSDLRCIKYQDVLTSALGPLPNFYLYDVVRSGIPATDAYFTYTDPLGNTNEISTDTYGYVGRYCMEENSYMNNLWNLFSFTQVGICYPDNQGTTYPYPASPQFGNTYFTFTFSPTTHVEGFSLYDSAGNPIFIQNGIYNNNFYIDPNLITSGTYFARYYIYDNNGNYITKFGFRGYPAKKVIILSEMRWYYTVNVYENCQFVTSQTWALDSQPTNFWYNTSYRQYYLSGEAPYTVYPDQDLPGSYFNQSSCDSGSGGFENL